MLLLGAALLARSRSTKRAPLAVQLLAVPAGIIALVGVTAHAYGTSYLYGSMALNTSLASLIAATGVLWSQVDTGIAALLAGATPGGVLARRLVPPIIAIPLLLGWFRLAGERAGLYDTPGGTALLVVSTIAVLVGLTAWSARTVDRADAERRGAEQALRDSEHRLFQILEAMPVAVFVLDAAGHPYYVNEASREILGRGIAPGATPGQLPEVYQAFVAGTSDPYPPERQPIAQAMRGERAYVADIEIHRPDRVVPIEVWAAPVRDAAGRVTFAIAAFSDISERQRAQQALRASEERFRLLVGTVRDYAILMLDPTGHVTSWNSGAQRIKGYAPEEIIGRHFSCFHPPEAVAAGTPETALRIAADAGRFEEENWRLRQDGSRFWANVIITAVRDAGGTLVGYAKVTRDLTERRRAEEAVRASEERFRAVATTANDAIVSADRDGRITYVNPGAERIFGYAADEVVGQELTVLMPEGFYTAHRTGLARYLATGEARVVGKTVELAGRRRHGTEFPLELSLASWRRDDEVAFTAIIRDVTERRRAEQALRRYAAQLEAANAELDAFAYSVSHDLRAPLRSIDGFSLALLEDSDDRLDDAGRDHLRRVRAATQRMGVLIDDLLKLARVTRAELKRAPVDLTALAHSVTAELARGAPQRQVEVAIADGLAAEADPRLLRVVLENLLGNAWKYTAKQSRARIEFGATRQDGGRAFYVRDDGAGFDMKYAGKLFGAFQRLHAGAEFEGTGVGLATVQRIVHRHGGRVWAEGRWVGAPRSISPCDGGHGGRR